MMKVPIALIVLSVTRLDESFLLTNVGNLGCLDTVLCCCQPQLVEQTTTTTTTTTEATTTTTSSTAAPTTVLTPILVPIYCPCPQPQPVLQAAPPPPPPPTLPPVQEPVTQRISLADLLSQLQASTTTTPSSRDIHIHFNVSCNGGTTPNATDCPRWWFCPYNVCTTT